jgi:hypothetical protein
MYGSADPDPHYNLMDPKHWLQDWPPDGDIAEYIPRRFHNLVNDFPIGAYTLREGPLNLASYMPDYLLRPELGPKMYIAYGEFSFRSAVWLLPGPLLQLRISLSYSFPLGTAGFLRTDQKFKSPSFGCLVRLR